MFREFYYYEHTINQEKNTTEWIDDSIFRTIETLISTLRELLKGNKNKTSNLVCCP